MKARVLITKLCNRACPGCCNKLPWFESTCRSVSLDEIRGYDEIMLTGGEPLLEPEKLIEVAWAVLGQNLRAKLYLYTALWTDELPRITGLFDGIHFTLHADPVQRDLDGFQHVQRLAGATPRLSWRCFIDDRVPLDLLTIHPEVWDRFEHKPWLEDCPLPEDDLLYLDQV